MRSKNKQIRLRKHKDFQEKLEWLTEYFNQQYPGWQRTKNADHIKMRINRTAKKWTTGIYNRKIKAVYKKDFPKDQWPFKKVDQVIIVQTKKKNAIVKMVTVMIGLEEYALSGLAADFFNITLLSAANWQVPGISTGPFWKIGVEL